MKEDYSGLVIVDVQPFYENGFEHLIPDYIQKIETTNLPIIYFFVGEELANESKDDVIMFLLKNGLSEEKCDSIKFIEKDYGFYRAYMDLGVSSEGIVEILKAMQELKINDIRNILDDGYETLQEWEPSLINKLSKKDLEKANYLLTQGEVLHLPYFNSKIFNVLDKNKKIELIGGGRWECLEEISIHLKSIGFNTDVNEILSYGAEPINFSPKKKNRL